MRPFWLILCLFPLLVCAQMHNTERQFSYQKELKVNLLYVGAGILQVHYEKHLNPNQSTVIWGSLIDFGFQGNLMGFEVGAGQRAYFNGTKPNTYFVEPNVSYLYIEDRYVYSHYNTVGIGILLGKKWALGNRLGLELYTGPTINFGFVKEGTLPNKKIDTWAGPLNGIFGRFGLTLNYRFN
ncbi:MAG: hypothetical protein CFE21_14175 [Bacteroidetes bacterium B1(2017)]|nr:MAG: hypothetical protein CFE21_14175 [Bacteroidetes bacterium B1(2017)]